MVKLKTEKEIRKQIEDSKEQERTSVMEHKEIFYGGYRLALKWALGEV